MNKMKKKEKSKIITNRTDQEEAETEMQAEVVMEMKQAFVKTERLFVTYVVKKVTWRQSANSKTKLLMMIGT